MWTIFKVFTEFVIILLLFYVLVFWPRGMWDLSSPTRNRTRTPGIGKQNLNHWTAREVSGQNFKFMKTSRTTTTKNWLKTKLKISEKETKNWNGIKPFPSCIHLHIWKQLVTKNIFVNSTKLFSTLQWLNINVLIVFTYFLVICRSSPYPYKWLSSIVHRKNLPFFDTWP